MLTGQNHCVGVLADDGDVRIVDNAELAAVAAITYSDLLLGMLRWLETGSCITFQMKRKISWLKSRSR
jgi:hypothetical protein